VVAGVDVGGTNIVGGLVDGEGRCLVQTERSTQAYKGADAVYLNIINVVQDVLHWARRESIFISSLGVSTAGQVDSHGVIVYATDTFPGWIGYPLRERLQDELGLDVFVENDAFAAGWGEKSFGIARDIQDFVMITLGTGIGGSIFTKGGLLTGSANLAGLIGHMTVDPFGVECNCGGRGCLECYASGTAISKQAREALDLAVDSPLVQLFKSKGDITAKDVFDAARLGDSVAHQVLDCAATCLGAGVGSLINVLNPELVVLSGGLSRAGNEWLHLIEESAKRYSTSAAIRGVKIQFSEFLSNCGLIGAAAVAHSSGIRRILA
jgi:glucokinase